MKLETCYDCGAVYDAGLILYEDMTYHMDWHYRLDTKVADLETMIEDLQKELASE